MGEYMQVKLRKIGYCIPAMTSTISAYNDFKFCYYPPAVKRIKVRRGSVRKHSLSFTRCIILNDTVSK